jgi:cobalt/nickel transport system permease protein
MDTIDRYAHGCAIRCVDPAQKAALVLLATGLCLLIDRPLASLLALAWALSLTVLWARVPVRVFARATLGQGLLLASSVVGAAMSAGVGAAPSRIWAVALGPLWLGAAPEALGAALCGGARALGCASALTFLALTTPLPDLAELLRRMRAPAALVDLLTLTYRAAFVLLESLRHVRLGHRAPARQGPRRAMAEAGLLAGRLFLDAYRRGLRLGAALDPAAIEATVRARPAAYTRTTTAWWLGAAMAASLLLASIVG